VIVEQEGKRLYNVVEELRHLLIRHREHPGSKLPPQILKTRK